MWNLFEVIFRYFYKFTFGCIFCTYYMIVQAFMFLKIYYSVFHLFLLNISLATLGIAIVIIF